MDNRMRALDRRYRLEAPTEEELNAFADRLRDIFGEPDFPDVEDITLVRKTHWRSRARFGQNVAVYEIDSGWVVPLVVLFRCAASNPGDQPIDDTDWDLDERARASVLEGRLVNARVFWGYAQAREFLYTTTDGLWGNMFEHFLNTDLGGYLMATWDSYASCPKNFTTPRFWQAVGDYRTRV